LDMHPIPFAHKKQGVERMLVMQKHTLSLSEHHHVFVLAICRTNLDL